MKRRLLALWLALCLVLSVLPGSVFAAGSSTILAFTSDVHNKSDNQSANRLKGWIDEVRDQTGHIDYMGFCGDLGDAGARETAFWNYVKAVIDVVTNEGIPACYTTGNHEMDPNNGNFLSSTNSVKNYYTVGAAPANVPMDANYRIYCLGCDSTTNNSYSTNQINALSAYLDGVDNSKPIIVLTHFPLHSYSSGSSWGWGGNSRQTANADRLIDALNAKAGEGKTIIFLWGHNHTLSDTYYDEIYAPGRSIAYTTSGSTKTIQFYYAAAGCMSDTEYSGGSNSVKGKGLVLQIRDNNALGFSYVNASGDDVTEGGGSLVLDPVAATGIQLDKSAVTVAVGKTLKLTATVEPSDATNKNVTWSSDDTAVATVDGSGKVKGVSVGTATVTATAEDGEYTASCLVTVIENTSTEQNYVITIDGYALSTEHSNDQLINTGNGSQRYYYHGRAGVEYTDEVAANPPEEIRWIVTETDGGYYIQSLDGRY
ncbi:MAG: Ig-like domain-containing protein, partial [Lachnospiraceae bacterium]|nr:Ig-like domain-containing protein [Lachnospiraceae bacterium]